MYPTIEVTVEPADAVAMMGDHELNYACLRAMRDVVFLSRLPSYTKHSLLTRLNNLAHEELDLAYLKGELKSEYEHNSAETRETNTD